MPEEKEDEPTPPEERQPTLPEERQPTTDPWQGHPTGSVMYRKSFARQLAFVAGGLLVYLLVRHHGRHKGERLHR